MEAKKVWVLVEYWDFEDTDATRDEFLGAFPTFLGAVEYAKKTLGDDVFTRDKCPKAYIEGVPMMG